MHKKKIFFLEEDLLLAQEDLLLVQEEGLLRVLEGDLLHLQEAYPLPLREEDLLLVREEEILAVQEEDLLRVQEEDPLLVQEGDLLLVEYILFATLRGVADASFGGDCGDGFDPWAGAFLPPRKIEPAALGDPWRGYLKPASPTCTLRAGAEPFVAASSANTSPMSGDGAWHGLRLADPSTYAPDAKDELIVSQNNTIALLSARLEHMWSSDAQVTQLVQDLEVMRCKFEIHHDSRRILLAKLLQVWRLNLRS